MANLAALDSMTTPKFRTTMEWWESFNDEDRALLTQVILNNPGPTVLEALQNCADYPFSLTTLKALRETLRKDN